MSLGHKFEGLRSLYIRRRSRFSHQVLKLSSQVAGHQIPMRSHTNGKRSFSYPAGDGGVEGGAGQHAVGPL